jgi:hypothetical protein
MNTSIAKTIMFNIYIYNLSYLNDYIDSIYII